MLSDVERQQLLNACRSLPEARGNYLIGDYVTNLVLTVIDFQMHTTAVERAYEFFVEHRRPTIQTHQELREVLSRYQS